MIVFVVLICPVVGYNPEVDDVLRRARAVELGVAPDSEAMAGFEPTAEDRVGALGEEAQALRGASEIGRASCRERVCLYV